jgi:prevent-host-death family protein
LRSSDLDDLSKFVQSSTSSTFEADLMSDVSTADARRNLTDMVNRVAYGKERFILTRHGKRLCALVPIEDLSFLDKLREAASRNDVSSAMSEQLRGDSIEWSDLRRELGIAE